MAQTPVVDIAFGRAAPNIPVRDIADACRFYMDILGFEKVFENGDPVGFVILQKDRAELHLTLAQDHTPSTVNATHILVDKIDALHAICEAAGVRIVKTIADKDHGMRAFVLADPDGNHIDIGQPLRMGQPAAPHEVTNQRMENAVFENCWMAGTRFENVNLAGASFSNVNLSGVSFTNVSLAGVTINDANIRGLTINGQRTENAVFDDCWMAGTRFENVNLSGASFTNVDLSGVCFTNVNLAGGTIDDANFQGLKIDGRDLAHPKT
jgi:catechol 2,3-dioxygenase-like lactoylglutathione lyase family enzyme